VTPDEQARTLDKALQAANARFLHRGKVGAYHLRRVKYDPMATKVTAYIVKLKILLMCRRGRWTRRCERRMPSWQHSLKVLVKL